MAATPPAGGGNPAGAASSLFSGMMGASGADKVQASAAKQSESKPMDASGMAKEGPRSPVAALTGDANTGAAAGEAGSPPGGPTRTA